MSEERAFWLAWSQVAGVGPTLLQRLYRHFGTLANAWEASASDLEAVEGVGPQTARAAVADRSRYDPIAFLHQHEQENPHFWTPADSGYPRLLREISDPPPVLYYDGTVNEEDDLSWQQAIAIVGTREPSDYGRRWTRRISATLAQAGYTIVSGLAEGIDTEAHASCLGARGRTIAVLGTGVDVVYPWSNRRLTEQIRQDGGLLLSEYPAKTQPDRTNFPRRNRIIAGLCRAILVLEAPHKSGALITAQLANDYGRDVYALPGSLDNARCKGCLELINQGAHLILSEKHLLDLLGEMPELVPKQSPNVQLSLLDIPPLPIEPLPKFAVETVQPELNLKPPLDRVLQAVSFEPTTFDLIVQQVNLETGLVLSALSQLELMGLIAQLPGMRYQKA